MMVLRLTNQLKPEQNNKPNNLQLEIDRTTLNRLKKIGIDVEKLQKSIEKKNEKDTICKFCTEEKCTCYECRENTEQDV